MRNQVFTYRGKDLAKPLSDLIVWLKDAEKALRDEMAASEPLKVQKNIIGAVDEVTQLYVTKQSKHRNIIGDILTAENWLRECKRTPRTKWTLDFNELEWLYKPQRIYVKNS